MGVSMICMGFHWSKSTQLGLRSVLIAAFLLLLLHGSLFSSNRVEEGSIYLFYSQTQCDGETGQLLITYTSTADILTFSFNFSNIFLLDGSSPIPGFHIDVSNSEGNADVNGHSFGEGIILPASNGEPLELCTLTYDIAQTFQSDTALESCFYNIGGSAESDGEPVTVDITFSDACFEHDICCTEPGDEIPGYEFGDGPDCNSECFGGAFLDNCGWCITEDSGLEPDWAMDECGICFGDNECLGCTDPTAMNFQTSAEIDDGSCIYGAMIPPVLEEELTITDPSGTMMAELDSLTSLYLNGQPIVEAMSFLLGPTAAILDFQDTPDRLSLEDIIENLPDQFELGDDDLYSFVPFDVWFSTPVSITLPHLKCIRDDEAQIYVFALDNMDDESWTIVDNAVCTESTCTFHVSSGGVFAIMTAVQDYYDCSGVPHGGAFVDNCGVCAGGETGVEACSMDCNGAWGGTDYLDPCGHCDSDTQNDDACMGCMDQEAYNFDELATLDNGSCIYVAPPGDVNGDLTIDVSDVILIIDMILNDIMPNEWEQQAGDLDEDGVITILDLVFIVAIILGDIIL